MYLNRSWFLVTRSSHRFRTSGNTLRSWLDLSKIVHEEQRLPNEINQSESCSYYKLFVTSQVVALHSSWTTKIELSSQSHIHIQKSLSSWWLFQSSQVWHWLIASCARQLPSAHLRQLKLRKHWFLKSLFRTGKLQLLFSVLKSDNYSMVIATPYLCVTYFHPLSPNFMSYTDNFQKPLTHLASTYESNEKKKKKLLLLVYFRYIYSVS